MEDSGTKPGGALRALSARPHTWLVLLLAGLAVYRFSLIDEGHFFWGDEREYVPAIDIVDALLDGDCHDAVACLFRQGSGRPGFVLLSALPALAQRFIAGALGLTPTSLASYDIPAAFNVLMSLVVTCCVFRLGRHWTGSPWFALLMATVHGLLCHANVWARHLMPYDLSMSLFLLGLILVSDSARMARTPARAALAAGLLTGFGFTCYPGYYAFVVINASVLLVSQPRNLRAMIAFGAGSAGLLGVFELLSTLAGTSYLRDMFAFSGTVSSGYFGEGYVFAWHYLRDVEGLVGMILFTMFLAFAASALWQHKVDLPRTARAAILAAVGCYLFHASMDVLFRKMIFFGRIFGMYLPFLVGGAVLALVHGPRGRVRWAGVCVLTAASIWSFGDFARRYSRIAYPADFLLGTMARIGHEIQYPATVLWGYVGDPADSIEELDSQFVVVADARPQGAEGPFLQLASHEEARFSGAEFIGVNLKWIFYPRQRDDRFRPPPGYALVAEALSPLALPSVGYNAYKPWERTRLLQRQYTMRIYARTHPVVDRHSDAE